MSHIHSISNQAEAAAQYQAYLARIRDSHQAKEKEKAQKKAGAQSFESYIDADDNSGQDSHQDEPEEDEDENKGFSAKA
jgi:hypothetical protein